jgi:hypothetical protein
VVARLSTWDVPKTELACPTSEARSPSVKVKDLALAGAFLILTACGAAAFSLDALWSRSGARIDDPPAAAPRYSEFRSIGIGVRSDCPLMIAFSAVNRFRLYRKTLCGNRDIGTAGKPPRCKAVAGSGLSRLDLTQGGGCGSSFPVDRQVISEG